MHLVMPLPRAMITLSSNVVQTMRAVSLLIVGNPCLVNVTTMQLKMTARFASSDVAEVLTASNAAPVSPAAAACSSEVSSGGLFSSDIRSLPYLLFGETVYRRCRDVEY